MKPVNEICELLLRLKEESNTHNENIENFFVQGYSSEPIVELFNEILSLIKGETGRFFRLNIDDELIDPEDFDNVTELWAEYELTFYKKRYIQEVCSGAGDVDEILYLSLDVFMSENNGLGLSSPLLAGVISNSVNTRIHIYGSSVFFGGPKLAVIPTNFDIPRSDWLSGSLLPSNEVISKQLHIISGEQIIVNPQRFELTWGDIDNDLAIPFRNAYAQHLLLSLCTNYYSLEKVQLKGVKHTEASLNPSDLGVDSELLTQLSECIKWCYSIEDPSTPLQLLIDRLSLELTSSNLMDIRPITFEHALDQAKSNYRFVIAKRSDDYRKELKDVFTDIQLVTDKFSNKAFSLASELLKSLLAIGFVFTVGSVSKAVVHGGLLSSNEGQVLFKLASAYLVVSFFFGWLNASADLKISESALKSWSKKLNSHISFKEVEDLIKDQIFWSKWFYRATLFVVTLLQFSIVILMYYAAHSMRLLGI